MVSPHLLFWALFTRSWRGMLSLVISWRDDIRRAHSSIRPPLSLVPQGGIADLYALCYLEPLGRRMVHIPMHACIPDGAWARYCLSVWGPSTCIIGMRKGKWAMGDGKCASLHDSHYSHHPRGGANGIPSFASSGGRSVRGCLVFLLALN